MSSKITKDSGCIAMSKAGNSCGIVELGDIVGPSAELAAAIGRGLCDAGMTGAFLMASDRKNSPSVRIMKYLQKKGLIRNMRTSVFAINPNSGNAICVMVAAINHDRFLEFYNALPEDPDSDGHDNNYYGY